MTWAVGSVAAIASVTSVVVLFAGSESEQPATPDSPGLEGSRSSGAALEAAPDLPPDLAAHLDRLRVRRGAAIESSGPIFDTWRVHFPGVSSATFAQSRADSRAWGFVLEGMKCDAVHRLGDEVVELSRRRSMASNVQAWYRVDGGPLAHSYVRLFGDDRRCTVELATVPYWQLKGEKLP